MRPRVAPIVLKGGYDNGCFTHLSALQIDSVDRQIFLGLLTPWCSRYSGVSAIEMRCRLRSTTAGLGHYLKSLCDG